MKKLIALLALLLAGPALAQSVQQSGTVTRGHLPYWVTSGVLGDGGSAADSPISTIGATGPICSNSARQSSGAWNSLCLQANTSSAATLTLQNYGTASAQSLQFVINGTAVTFPTSGGNFLVSSGALINGHLPCFSGTAGIVVDCGTSIGAGTAFGLPYYSTTSSIASTAAATNGQMLVGQTAAAPLWETLSGDVTSISAGGAVTLGKVNGVTFGSTYTAHGVLIGEGTGQFSAVATSNIGQCLLSQGSSDPAWASCASGSGSAGGSNTQVQYNNSTSLGGSTSFTWVSPTLTIGLAGSTTGQLALAPAGSGSGTVTIQNPSTTSGYNFNLPTTAGSSGQPLLSGGGGATAMSFGVLGTAAGGTNCTSASGTCIDNISAWASTGYVFRSGGGVYTFSTVIPVSSGGTSLANGTSGGVLTFTGSTTIASSGLLAQYGIVMGGGAGATPATLANGTAGQILQAQTSANPAWNTLSGDATITSGGAITVSASAITNSKLANANAYTFKGNTTSSPAAPTDFTPGSLVNKASPAAGDYIVIADNAASGALKYATISSVASAGSVGSLNGLTGAVTLLTEPQGRLTLTANTPVMTATAAAQTTLRYDAYIGNQVPYFTGSADALDTITSNEVTDAMVSAASAGQVVSGQVYDVWWVHSGANRICIAMSSSSGGGGGWASDTGGSNTARGTGFSQLDLVTRPYITNKNSIANCFNAATNYGAVSANQGTYLGTVLASANGQITWQFAIIGTSGGTGGIFGLYNQYNRVDVATTGGDTSTGYTDTTAGWRQARGTTVMQVQYVNGGSSQQDAVLATFSSVVNANAGASIFCGIGIGVDATSAVSNGAGAAESLNNGTGVPTVTANYTGYPGIGSHIVAALEFGATTCTPNLSSTPLSGNNYTFKLRM